MSEANRNGMGWNEIGKKICAVNELIIKHSNHILDWQSLPLVIDSTPRAYKSSTVLADTCTPGHSSWKRQTRIRNQIWMNAVRPIYTEIGHMSTVCNEITKLHRPKRRDICLRILKPMNTWYSHQSCALKMTSFACWAGPLSGNSRILSFSLRYSDLVSIE